MNATRCRALIADLERCPRRVQLHHAELKSLIARCMDEIFELAKSGEEKERKMELVALECDLGNFLRRLALPRSAQHWSLTTPREKLIKIGANVVRQTKYVTFRMAEVAVPRELFAEILDRIQRFGVPPPLLRRG